MFRFKYIMLQKQSMEISSRQVMSVVFAAWA